MMKLITALAQPKPMVCSASVNGDSPTLTFVHATTLTIRNSELT
jgi:hypothetical protein